MCPGNVRSAEGGREPHSPPPEPQAQRLRIVMSNMKRYLCLIGGRKVSADASSVFLCMKRWEVLAEYGLTAPQIAESIKEMV